MNYASQQHRGTKRAKSRRKDRDQICIGNSGIARTMSDKMGVPISIYVGAACLWFESLDREQQAGELLKINGKCQASNVAVHDQISELVRSWRFPLYSMGRVVGAAVLGFSALDETEAKSWLKEVIVFVGDPRFEQV
jgi:hypothetical protein